jgi:S-DNA-T family DNA segregation ATPase FtsK/SpoIIIE
MAERRMLQAQAATIDAVLKRHRVPSHVGQSVETPRALRFELMAEGQVAVATVENLAGEFAAALGASAAQVRRSDSGVCVEVPQPIQPLRLLPLCDSLAQTPPLTAVLGVDSEGAPLLLRLPAAEVGDVLIAGMTGAGKTALARTMITSLAIFNQPNNLQIVLIDPKARGFAPLQGLPHVLGELVSAPEDVRDCLLWLIGEMERRSATQVTMPTLVVAIDEMADLIQTGGSKVEAMLSRLCEGGRETGIYLIACTQKPTAELIGSVVKASFQVRLVGAVASREEARYATGINESAAERLEGKGDFLLISGDKTWRFQAAWIGPKDLEHAKSLLHAGVRPAQWARAIPAAQQSLGHARVSAAHRTTLEKADPAFALYPESRRTLWQSIIARLAGL